MAIFKVILFLYWTKSTNDENGGSFANLMKIMEYNYLQFIVFEEYVNGHLCARLRAFFAYVFFSLPFFKTCSGQDCSIT